LPSIDGTARELRDRPLGRFAILAAVLLAAFLVSRSCGETRTDVSQEQAVAIAKAQVDFEPDDVRIRLQKRGVVSKPFWLVGLGIKEADGSYSQAVNVLIDAETGSVEEVRQAPLSP
jgi:Peptidase propeptide and YPEB domain